jgi:hypothetical protein
MRDGLGLGRVIGKNRTSSESTACAAQAFIYNSEKNARLFSTNLSFA